MTEPSGGELAEAGWRYLCERAGVVVLLLDAALTVRFANQHARQLTGRTLAGSHLSQILLGVQEDRPGRLLVDASETNRIVNVRTAAGLPETLYVTLMPIGADLLFFGQINAEEQARLRREVLTLSHELANLSRELARSNADLAELNEQKNRFLGMATHDLRKPAGLVLSYAELLAEELGDTLPAEQRKLLDTIRSSAERMRLVIDDFLDVAMIESGQLNLERATTAIAALFVAPLQLVALSAARRNIMIATEPDLPGFRLRVDGPKLEQVFTNLLSNAIEHAPGGSTVRIGCEVGPEGIRFSVSDAGPGMSEEQRAGLFRDFSATGGRKSDGERSIGLGLAIARRIVEAHGGHVFAISTPGGGATVGFSLPATCLTTVVQGNQQGVS